MTRADWVLLTVIAILLPAVYAATWNAGTEGTEVTIRSGRGAPQTVSLQQDRRLRIAGRLGDSVIEIRHGKARFLSSPCNSKICIHSGWLHETGEFAACLPNGVSMTVAGGRRRFDAINF